MIRFCYTVTYNHMGRKSKNKEQKVRIIFLEQRVFLVMQDHFYYLRINEK